MGYTKKWDEDVAHDLVKQNYGLVKQRSHPQKWRFAVGYLSNIYSVDIGTYKMIKMIEYLFDNC